MMTTNHIFNMHMLFTKQCVLHISYDVCIDPQEPYMYEQVASLYDETMYSSYS